MPDTELWVSDRMCIYSWLPIYYVATTTGPFIKCTYRLFCIDR